MPYVHTYDMAKRYAYGGEEVLWRGAAAATLQHTVIYMMLARYIYAT